MGLRNDKGASSTLSLFQPCSESVKKNRSQLPECFPTSTHPPHIPARQPAASVVAARQGGDSPCHCPARYGCWAALACPGVSAAAAPRRGCASTRASRQVTGTGSTGNAPFPHDASYRHRGCLVRSRMTDGAPSECWTGFSPASPRACLAAGLI